MHTRPSAPRTDRIHGCLSRAKSRMVAPHDILSLHFSPLLTAPGSCHPDANLPVFITCWKERHVTGRASWRVTGLINPVWQLPDALSGSSPPSLSRTCIPVSRGSVTSEIYKLDNKDNSAATPVLFIRRCFLSNLSVSLYFPLIFRLRSSVIAKTSGHPARGEESVLNAFVFSCVWQSGVILMADLRAVQPTLEEQICVLGCADPSHPQTRWWISGQTSPDRSQPRTRRDTS